MGRARWGPIPNIALLPPPGRTGRRVALFIFLTSVDRVVSTSPRTGTCVEVEEVVTMSSGVGAGDNPDSNAYVCAVARALNAETIRRWDEVTFDAVVVVSQQFRYYSGRRILVAWNRYFGWTLGLEGQCADRVLIICGLGLGRRPHPEVIADRTDEVIADLLQLEFRARDAFPVPTVVHRLDSGTGPTDRGSSGW